MLNHSLTESGRGHDTEHGTTGGKSSLSRLLAHYTIEATPTEILKARAGLSRLAPGTSVYIPRLPKNDFDDTLKSVLALRDMGLHPVPHITARTLRDKNELERQLFQLVDEAEVDEILLLAGSDAEPVGAFENTLQVIESGVIERSGIRTIGVAGHPEGHPDVSEENLFAALDTKQRFATEAGLSLHIVTQFFFEAEPVVAWETRLRERDITLPIHIGLHGVGSTTSLLKHAIACGVGASIRALRAQTQGLRQLIGRREPTTLMAAFAQAVSRDPDSLFRSFHFFPLGTFDQTVEWANEARQSALSDDGA